MEALAILEKLVFILLFSSVAKALGHPLDDLTLSRSTIRRARIATRKEVSETDKEYFSTEHPLQLHWDGKMLPDIGGGTETVDRIAVLVTGNGIEKLLVVPKIGRGTGEEQASACLKVLDDWNIRHKVRGLVFDTTSSNTGIHRGACVTIERAIGQELVNIGCRHHIMEVILSSVFLALFGGTGAPEVGMFKRFQKKWSGIQQAQYSPAEDELFDAETETLRRKMISERWSSTPMPQVISNLARIASNSSACVSSSSVEQLCFRKKHFVHQGQCTMLAGCLRRFMH